MIWGYHYFWKPPNDPSESLHTLTGPPDRLKPTSFTGFRWRVSFLMLEVFFFCVFLVWRSFFRSFYISSFTSWVGEITITRWWFQTCVIFTPIWARFPFWGNIFSLGLKPPPSWWLLFFRFEFFSKFLQVLYKSGWWNNHLKKQHPEDFVSIFMSIQM